MDNIKNQTDIDWDAASERVQKEMSKSLEKLTGILAEREDIREDKPENELIKVDELMHYLKAEFPSVFNNHFTYELVENLVDYAYKTHGHSKGSARAIVCEILPEVDEEELKQFLPDFRASTNKTEASSIEADVIKRRKGGR